VNLTTQYLGLTLENPFMPGASPLADDIGTALRLEDAGAAAIVTRSLFEEDIRQSSETTDRYLEHLLRLRRRLSIPIIASLNGTAAASWLKYAAVCQLGGADALELNFYHVATDLEEDAASVERRIVDVVAVLKESIRIPVAVKLSPFYSALPHLAAQLDRIGADGLVLFNRFYQPDIDPERCEPSMQLRYSDSSELPLRLRWIAILSGRLRLSLALTGGVHQPIDAVKAVLAGAHAVQIVSALMLDGPQRLAEIREKFARWGDEHRFESVAEMCGAASLSRCANPSEFERGNYQRLLQSAVCPGAWQGH
jgi:dihydroorotate dehydrogenase (fumarate)